jgi:hypothetical protein
MQVQGVGHESCAEWSTRLNFPFLAYELQDGLFSISNFWMPKWKWKHNLAGILD